MSPAWWKGASVCTNRIHQDTQLRRKLKKCLREVAKKHQMQYQTCFWQFLTFYSTQVSRLLVGKKRALEKDKPTNAFSGPDFKGAFFTIASHVPRPLVGSGPECDAYMGEGLFSRPCPKHRSMLVLT